MSLPARSARARFAEQLARPEPEVDLARAALLVAAEEYPQLVPEPYLQRLDVYAERVRDRLSEESAPLLVLQELARVLFVEDGLRGNTEAYYDPRNSFLNDVLDRRVGIPLTLSIVYLEVGWRLGLPLHGVNFPGHFLVRFEGEALRLLIDPFLGGLIRFEDEAQELLDRAYGGAVPLQPSYLRQADRKSIIVRLLSNLKGVYLNARDDARALAAIERILLIVPDAAEELRDRGLALTRLGRETEALSDLQRYLELAPEAPDVEGVRMLIRRHEEGA
ncbi:MAG TPA: transglutaminase-like domain-containing protein [Longimicrobiales bacterium]|nr:transglutaminase-like domain-containing protein [Longimicrobiales bacterium]